MEEYTVLCVMPGIGGTFIPTAFVKFGEGKNKYQQPIGSASFTASDLNIYVPEQTAKKRVAVSGFAPAFATVTIYDGATVIGQTSFRDWERGWIRVLWIFLIIWRHIQ